MPRKKLGRARNHEGTYQERKADGMIRFAQRIGERRLYGPFRSSREEAKAAWVAKHVTRPEPPKQVPSLGSWCFTLLNTATGQLNDLKERTTLEMDRTVFETAIKPHPIAEKRLDQITRDDVEEWRRSLRTKERKRNIGTRSEPKMEVVPSKPMMPSTVGRYLATLREVLSIAVQRGYIAMNPAAGVKPPKQLKEIEKRVLTPAEQIRFLALFEPGRERNAVILALHGLRRGEIGALRYEDLEDEGVWVRRQVLEIPGELVIKNFTKNRKDRWVPLDSDGLAILKRKTSGYVIATEDGKPVWPHNLHRAIKMILKGTEFEGVHLHDLRSSTAMTLLASGVDVRTSAEILGHDPAVLTRIYARSNQDLMRKAMQNRRKGAGSEPIGGANGGRNAA